MVTRYKKQNSKDNESRELIAATCFLNKKEPQPSYPKQNKPRKSLEFLNKLPATKIGENINLIRSYLCRCDENHPYHNKNLISKFEDSQITGK